VSVSSGLYPVGSCRADLGDACDFHRAFGFLFSSIIYYRPPLRRRIVIFLAHAYGESDLAREDSVAWIETVRQGEYRRWTVIEYTGKWLAAGLLGPGLVALIIAIGSGLEERKGALLCE